MQYILPHRNLDCLFFSLSNVIYLTVSSLLVKKKSFPLTDSVREEWRGFGCVLTW